jgi:hypothetical protein
MRIQSSTKKRAATVAATCAVIALTACSGQAVSGGTGTSGVASLPASSGQPSSGAETASASAGGQGGPTGLTGVTMPDNATTAERNRIEDTWASCMESHGDHDFATKSGGPGGYLTPTVSITNFPAAVQACRSLQPHPPWQEMPQYNPNYRRDFAQWVSCMNAMEVPVTAVPGGFDYDGTSSLSPSQQQKVTVECEMRAFDEN